MNGTGKYFVYRNGRVRIGLHLLFWIAIYAILLLDYNRTIDKDLWTQDCIAQSFCFWLTAVVVYYFIFATAYPLLLRKKLLQAVASILAAFCIAFLLPHFLLILLRNLFPTIIIKKDNAVEKNITSQLFSKENFRLFIGITIWYCFLTIAVKLAKNMYIEFQEKKQVEEERNKTELNFLRAQIKPHFLFNALNSVYGLSIDNDKASGMVLRLSNLLRYTLYNKNNNAVTLREEINFLTDYIELEKLRHKQDKVVIEYDFSKIDNDAVRIKPMILSNILQYAFVHSGAAFFINIILSERGVVLSLNIDCNSITVLNNEDADWQNIERILATEYAGKYLLEMKNDTIKLVLNLQEDEQ